MAKKSKNSVAAKRQYDKSALYGPEDAVGLVRSMAFAKFDESIDVVFTLGIDARRKHRPRNARLLGPRDRTDTGPTGHHPRYAGSPRSGWREPVQKRLEIRTRPGNEDSDLKW
jgi:hypothetical protein